MHAVVWGHIMSGDTAETCSIVFLPTCQYTFSVSMFKQLDG